MRGYLNDAGTLCLYCAASTTADRHDRNPGPRRVELRTEAPPPGLRIEHSAAVGRIVDVR
jgi:hypothetical protein